MGEKIDVSNLVKLKDVTPWDDASWNGYTVVYEFATLKAAWDHCRRPEHHEEAILYLHSKGSTRPSKKKKGRSGHAWYEIMAHFTIGKFWRDCLGHISCEDNSSSFHA